MSGLAALLITSIDDEIPFNKFFPFDYSDQFGLTELMIVSQYFNKCGKGSLQHKNKIFYYRTYIPTLIKADSNSISNESISDYFIYSYDYHKKRFFILYLCDLKYKIKNIDNLTNDIFAVLDNNAFEGHEIKRESSNQINALFIEYKNIEPNLGKINQLTELNPLNNSDDSLNTNNNSSSIDKSVNKTLNKSKKRIDSRMVLPIIKKADTVSADIDDITTVRETVTDLSVMFNNNLDTDLYIPQVNKWKSIKIINIFLCLGLFIIMLTIFILFLK